MGSRKGQIFSTDLTIAMLVLLAILVSFLVLWSAGTNRIAYFESERWREEAARFAVESLVETAGYPTHWEQIDNLSDTNIRSLGLARSRNVLNPDKVQKFVSIQNTQYDFMKRVLGVQRYDLRVLITDLDGNELHSFKSAPPSDKVVTTVSRLALLNETMVVVRVYVWE